MNNYVPFLTKCMSRGFGSMSKRDYDVALFDSLLSGEFDDKDKGICYKNKSDSELSRLLGMTLQKIRNLKIESSLRYHSFNDENTLNNICKETLEKTKYRVVTPKVFFVVEDPIIRSYLYETLRKNQSFFDTSFNQDIVSVDINDLIFLWDTFFDCDQKRKYLEMVPADLKEQSFAKSIFNAITNIKVGIPPSIGDLCSILQAGANTAKVVKKEFTKNQKSNFK